jgi:putative membrane protein
MSLTPPPLIRNALYGLLMGGADIIPGVSGGTMALIVGVYERLVGAISTAVSVGLALLRLDLEAAQRHWADVPWGLVLPLGFGIVGAIKVGALVIPDLMATHPAQMRGLFLGLVGASLLIPALRIRRLTALRAALGVACAGAAFLLTGLPVLEAREPGLLRVFASASVAVCAMILPGISGAFLLEVLGIYTPTLEALNALDGPYVLTFVAGAAVGLGGFAKGLDWLLSRRHDATMAALVGLIAGALRALWPYTGPGRSLRLPGPDAPILSVVALSAVGFAAVVALLWWGRRSAETAASAP